MKYAVVMEKGPTSYGAHVPDLPGCVAAAETREEVCTLIREAIDLYVEALEEDGHPVPDPRSYELINVQRGWGKARDRSHHQLRHQVWYGT